MLFTYLGSSHHRVRELLASVLAAMERDTPDLATLWSELDHDLRAHMDAEEQLVLPAFARIDRDEAFALLREHGVLREQLFELGIAVDLHQLRFARSKEFADTLEHHAAREERLLYRWAERELAPDTLDAIERRVGAR